MPQQTNDAQKIDALLNSRPQLVDLSLGRMKHLLRALGSPQQHLPPVIHIAGTNGKGSAAAFARAFLEAAGMSAHVYTSPHLVHWRERYRLGSKQNGKAASAFVSDALLAETLAEVARANKNAPCTVFEILTAAAFVLFARFPADAAVLEVGLGGRFDATNCISRPAAALIMPIAFDHEAFLGKTIAKIAAEKAGIIKKYCPIVLGRQIYPRAAAIIRRAARQQNAPLSLYGRDYRIKADAESAAGKPAWLFENAQTALRLPPPRLAGSFQTGNAAAALQAVLAAGFSIPPAAAAAAMGKVTWPARLQKLTAGSLRRQAPQKADLWLDGGHNPAAAEVLAAECAPMLRGRPFFMLCAMLQNKDYVRYFRHFAALKPQIYPVPLGGGHQAALPGALAAAARESGLQARPMPSLSAALALITAQAKAKPGKPPFILICGSLYLAGEALAQNGAPPQ